MVDEFLSTTPATDAGRVTPLAQALLNKKPGDEVDFEMDGTKKRYRIDSIEVCPPMPAQAEAVTA